MKWFHESPREEKDGFEFGGKNKEDGGVDIEEDKIKGPSLRRTRSDPHHSSLDRISRAKWGRLRSPLPQMAQQGQNSSASPHGAPAVTSYTVNITDGLVTGLSTLMLRV
ncbi:Phospholipase D1 [Stygiomarasmius scandens]|uniref:Phospholipase D1 n=1 Tax=Marasmiellus scandens TaxID=2682957 RepID=A0ABR1IWR4_9AGAR